MPDIGSADVSSYPKAPLPVQNPLDVASKINSYQQQNLAINQAQMDQANQGLTYLARAVSSLGPNATEAQYRAAGDQVTRQLGLPPEKTAIWNEQVDAAKGPDGKFDSQGFFKHAMSQIASHGEILNIQTGTPVEVNDNANHYFAKRDPITGAASGGNSLPVQVPPTQPNVNNQPIINGKPNPAYMQPGIVGASAPAGFTPVAPPARRLPVQPLQPGPVANPAIVGNSSNFGGNVVGANVEPPTNAATGAAIQSAAKPIVTGPPPNFDVGQKLYARDQDAATSKATSLKPLEEAYDLAKTVATGAGTEPLNKARAYLANAGLIKADEKSPTVIYQMLNKNLAQFIDKTGSRSDADLAVKESGNANAKTQLQPALLHMVQKIIGRERIEIARPQAFEGADYQNYGKHSASFPTSQDERAYSLDKMPPDEAKQLYSTMRTKALAGDPEGIKFIQSLVTAKKANLVTGLGK